MARSTSGLLLDTIPGLTADELAAQIEEPHADQPRLSELDGRGRPTEVDRRRGFEHDGHDVTQVEQYRTDSTDLAAELGEEPTRVGFGFDAKTVMVTSPPRKTLPEGIVRRADVRRRRLEIVDFDDDPDDRVTDVISLDRVRR